MSRSPLDVRAILSRNAAWNYGSMAVNIVVNLLLFRYVVSRIGETAGGIWLLLASVNSYFGLLQLGTVPAVMPLFAGHVDRKEDREANRLASTTLALLSGLGLVPIVLLPGAPLLVRLLNIPPQLHRVAAIVFALGFANVAVQMPGQALNAFLSGAQRQDRCAQVWILTLAARMASAVLVLQSGFGLVALVAADLLIAVGVDIILAAFTFRSVPSLSFSWRYVNSVDARRVMRFGTVLFVSNLCGLFIEQTDRIVIAAFLPVAMVTYYAAAWKLYTLASVASAALVYALAPVAGALAGRADSERLRRLTLRMSKYSVGLAVLMGGMLCCGAAPILNVWLGPAFADHAYVAQILFAGFIALAFNTAVASTLVGIQRIAPVVWAYSVPQAIANLALSLFLVTRYGIAGVALGTAIPAIALEPIFLIIAFRELGITWTSWASDVVRPVIAPAVWFVPAGVAMLVADRLSPMVLLAAVGGGVAYSITFVARSLSAEEREVLWTTLATLIGSRRSNRLPVDVLE